MTTSTSNMNTSTSLAFKSEIEALEAFAEGHFSFSSLEGMENSEGIHNTSNIGESSSSDWGCDTSLHRRSRHATTAQNTVYASPPPVGPFPPDCLQVVCLMRGNNKCVDCQASLDPDDYMYACIAYGTLLCMECANIHRSNPNLKGAASQIKSIHAEDWEFPQVLTMLEGGNAHFTKVCKSLETQEDRLPAEATDNNRLLFYLNPAVHSYSQLLKHQSERVYQAHQRALAEMDMPQELVAECVMDAVLPVAANSPPDLSRTTTMHHSNNNVAVAAISSQPQDYTGAGATAQARIMEKRASLDHIPSGRSAYAYLSSSSKTKPQTNHNPGTLQNQDQPKPDPQHPLPTSSSPEDPTEESYLPFPSVPRRLSEPHHYTESTYDKYDYQQCSELLESWGQDKFDTKASDFDLEDEGDGGTYRQHDSGPLPPNDNDFGKENNIATPSDDDDDDDDDDDVSDISDSSSPSSSGDNMMLHLRELVWTIGKKVVPLTTTPPTPGRDPLVGRDFLIASQTEHPSTTDHPNAHLLDRYPYNIKMPSRTISSSSHNKDHDEERVAAAPPAQEDARPPSSCEKNIDSLFAHSYGVRHVSLLQQEQHQKLAKISKRNRRSSQIMKTIYGQAA